MLLAPQSSVGELQLVYVAAVTSVLCIRLMSPPGTGPDVGCFELTSITARCKPVHPACEGSQLLEGVAVSGSPTVLAPALSSVCDWAELYNVTVHGSGTYPVSVSPRSPTCVPTAAPSTSSPTAPDPTTSNPTTSSPTVGAGAVGAHHPSPSTVPNRPPGRKPAGLSTFSLNCAISY